MSDEPLRDAHTGEEITVVGAERSRQGYLTVKGNGADYEIPFSQITGGQEDCGDPE